MQPREQYSRVLEAFLQGDLTGESLLLHSCCGPCSSYVLEYLSAYLPITLYYYNPNIVPEPEYQLRLAAQTRICTLLPAVHPVKLVAGDYDPAAFAVRMQGTEGSPEGGERCRRCIALRLREAAQMAIRCGCTCFTTTLTISPHKDAPFINACGAALEREYGVKFLPSDFKKRGGFKRSIELSREYGLYRQDYCGCAASAAEAEERRNRRENEK